VKVDQAAAEGIDSRNVRRVIRALEVQRQSGRSFSRRQTKKAPPLHTLIIGLTASRGELYRRIDSRVDGMMAQGLVAEVENLARMGYDFNLPAMSSIGYRQIGMYLKKEISLPAAVQQIKFETHRFARHQYAWFRLNDRRIHWFDIVEQSELEIEPFVAESLKGEGATASLLSAENS
jgi:tRNA dimethylallyltransferase